MPGATIYARWGPDRRSLSQRRAQAAPGGDDASHGVRYNPEYDGAYLGDLTRAGGFVGPEEEFTYVWEATPDSVGVWPYHDHGPSHTLNTTRGLFGAIVVRERGAPRPTRPRFVQHHSRHRSPKSRGAARINGRRSTAIFLRFFFPCARGVGQRVHSRVGRTALQTFHITATRWAHSQRLRDPHARPQETISAISWGITGRGLHCTSSATGRRHGRLVPVDHDQERKKLHEARDRGRRKTAFCWAATARRRKIPPPATGPGAGGGKGKAKSSRSEQKGCVQTIAPASGQMDGRDRSGRTRNYREGMTITGSLDGLELSGTSSGRVVGAHGKSSSTAPAERRFVKRLRRRQNPRLPRATTRPTLFVTSGRLRLDSMVDERCGVYGIYAFNSKGGRRPIEAFSKRLGLLRRPDPAAEGQEEATWENVTRGATCWASRTNMRYTTITRELVNNGAGIITNASTARSTAPQDNVIRGQRRVWNNFTLLRGAFEIRIAGRRPPSRSGGVLLSEARNDGGGATLLREIPGSVRGVLRCSVLQREPPAAGGGGVGGQQCATTTSGGRQDLKAATGYDGRARVIASPQRHAEPDLPATAPRCGCSRSGAEDGTRRPGRGAELGGGKRDDPAPRGSGSATALDGARNSAARAFRFQLALGEAARPRAGRRPTDERRGARP